VALIVEDGTGVVGAESYFVLTASTAYWTARPQDANGVRWLAANTASQEGAAREGTAYLDATWGTLFPGVRLSAVQGRLWPRIDRTDLVLSPLYPTVAELEAAQALSDRPLIGSDGLELAPLPTQIVTAAIELSARALVSRLAPDQGAQGWLKRRKTGPLEREWGGPGIPGGSYGFVDTLLAPVLIGMRNAQWTWR
jgi:hypothetical protein